ncbi:phospholipid scramblase 1 [Pleuronectes platessa]|uniref:phospholipid scramblase 1 n=1 Tax=Pleuronectes platessa TaxID=8262 RepID=UPI00232A32D6|nr:phospholipid scramblase 1 [Pleuronectes platessa]
MACQSRTLSDESERASSGMPDMSPMRQANLAGQAEPAGRQWSLERGYVYKVVEEVDQLLIKQKVEVVEALVGFESNNKYEVRNAMGQNVFYAVEENDCLSRQCCGPVRSFNIHVLDNFGQEVITVTRPLKCMSCFFPCCLQELEVQSPPGNTVGYVVQQWHPFSPKFLVTDEHCEPVLKIHGPFCGWSCLPDVDFEILTMDEVSKIGKISKQWTGLLREMFTDADNFGIQFPMDLDVKIKAVMIGACFLIDFMFFETNN